MNRRDLLSLAAAATAAPMAAGAHAPAAGRDLATAAGRMRAFLLMRGAQDERLVIGSLGGRYYGVVDAELRPLYGVYSATFARYRPRADGGCDGASYEASVYTDLATGEVLERFVNPYTGETVEPPHSNYPPTAFSISPTLEFTYAKPPSGLVSHHRVLAPRISGDDVWMTEEVMTALTLPGATRPVRYSELTTLHAKAADLAAPGTRRVPAQTDFTAIVSWRPWLKMGDRPGNLMASGQGRFVDRVDQLPAPLLAGLGRYRPEVLRDPAAPLAGLLV